MSGTERAHACLHRMPAPHACTTCLHHMPAPQACTTGLHHMPLFTNTQQSTAQYHASCFPSASAVKCYNSGSRETVLIGNLHPLGSKTKTNNKVCCIASKIWYTPVVCFRYCMSVSESPLLSVYITIIHAHLVYSWSSYIYIHTCTPSLVAKTSVVQKM